MNIITTLLESLNLSTLGMKPSLTDYIDIIIVAYLVYQITVWIKETRAWSLFKGIVVILAVCGVAYYLNLNTILWIIKSTFSLGLTAVVVIFQPELRKALEQLGNRKILPSFFASDQTDTKNTDATLEEIITAAYKMSEVRTGALILIEREVALGDLEQTGIPIDGIVTSQLLINIFEDKTPLHDGAVIIRKNRIAAASCIMPLTQSAIGLDLGTRHRAAVGASEVSDAYVIVVSEESGGVSVAKGGKLYRSLSQKEIRKMLSVQSASRKKAIFAKGRTTGGKSS